jgi:hypothetical protein
MKKDFFDDDREFVEDIFKKAANQEMHGPGIGNEKSRDIILDRFDDLKGISQTQVSMTVDENGIPNVLKERLGKIIECGHMVTALEHILGQCIYGHFVCTRCELHSCQWCGAKVCNNCVIITRGGLVLCPMHETRRMIRAITSSFFRC